MGGIARELKLIYQWVSSNPCHFYNSAIIKVVQGRTELEDICVELYFFIFSAAFKIIKKSPI